MPIEMTSRTLIERLYHHLQHHVEHLQAHDIKPKLGVVLVGSDPNSLTYVNIKQRQAEKLGIDFSLHRLDESASEATVMSVIEELNKEESVTGVIVQLPLPAHLNTDKILEAVAPEKDVDGLSSKSEFIPPMVLSVHSLLEGYDINVANKKIVIVGKGRLVGGPLLDFFKEDKLDVVACDKSTPDITALTTQADILISGTGVHHLIKADMVKEGAVVIDVDHEVDYEAVSEKVSYITPQTGGVGPLTVAFLLANVIEATDNQMHGEHE